MFEHIDHPHPLGKTMTYNEFQIGKTMTYNEFQKYFPKSHSVARKPHYDLLDKRTLIKKAILHQGELTSLTRQFCDIKLSDSIINGCCTLYRTRSPEGVYIQRHHGNFQKLHSNK